MSADQIAAAAALVLSLILSYAPGLAPKWESLDSGLKRVWTGVLILAVAAGAWGLSCAGLGGQLGLTLVCEQASGVELFKAAVAALVANQATYLITKG